LEIAKGFNILIFYKADDKFDIEEAPIQINQDYKDGTMI
jgi:hypothetical protein